MKGKLNVLEHHALCAEECTKPEVLSRWLRVRNVPDEADDDLLLELFSQGGHVRNLEKSGSPGEIFVGYRDVASALGAMLLFYNTVLLFNRALMVSFRQKLAAYEIPTAITLPDMLKPQVTELVRRFNRKQKEYLPDGFRGLRQRFLVMVAPPPHRPDFGTTLQLITSASGQDPPIAERAEKAPEGLLDYTDADLAPIPGLPPDPALGPPPSIFAAGPLSGSSSAPAGTLNAFQPAPHARSAQPGQPSEAFEFIVAPAGPLPGPMQPQAFYGLHRSATAPPGAAVLASHAVPMAGGSGSGAHAHSQPVLSSLSRLENRSSSDACNAAPAHHAGAHASMQPPHGQPYYTAKSSPAHIQHAAHGHPQHQHYALQGANGVVGAATPGPQSAWPSSVVHMHQEQPVLTSHEGWSDAQAQSGTLAGMGVPYAYGSGHASGSTNSLEHAPIHHSPPHTHASAAQDPNAAHGPAYQGQYISAYGPVHHAPGQVQGGWSAGASSYHPPSHSEHLQASYAYHHGDQRAFAGAGVQYAQDAQQVAGRIGTAEQPPGYGTSTLTDEQIMASIYGRNDDEVMAHVYGDAAAGAGNEASATEQHAAAMRSQPREEQGQSQRHQPQTGRQTQREGRAIDVEAAGDVLDHRGAGGWVPPLPPEDPPDT